MNITFQEWLKQLDAIFTARLLFISYYDAEDYEWETEWEQNYTPFEAFQRWHVLEIGEEYES